MPTESDIRPSDASDDNDDEEIAALLKALEIVRGIANTEGVTPGPRQRSELAAKVTQILFLLTDGKLAPFLPERLVNLAGQSHADLIAAVNPSLRLLKRRTTSSLPDGGGLLAAGVTVDEIALALDETEGETGYGLGDFVLVQNPYMVASDLHLKEPDPSVPGDRGSLNEARVNGRGGELRNFNGEGPWQPADSPNGHIPHPGEGTSQTWYWVTGHQPKDVYDAWQDTDHTKWDAIKHNARNIVKSVEIEYRPKINAGDSCKPPHLILLYAGGNST